MPEGQAEAERQWVCGCEKVKVNISGEPRFRIDCFCDDCHNATQYVMDKKIPGSLDKWAATDGGLQVATFYFKNVQVVSGEEYIQPFRMRPDSATTRFYTTCCGTSMFALANIPGGLGPWVTTGLRGKPLRPVDARVLTRCCDQTGVNLTDLPKDSISTVGGVGPIVGKLVPVVCCGCCYPGRGNNENFQMNKDTYFGKPIEHVPPKSEMNR
eukprot:GFYU01004526.1.p1 GENE.GFYU01004526.1~~GFYU01004526.1.p1  ORF type:complete len:212 (+),score=44.85 GFYU01004526.1:58-693(+)